MGVDQPWIATNAWLAGDHRDELRGEGGLGDDLGRQTGVPGARHRAHVFEKPVIRLIGGRLGEGAGGLLADRGDDLVLAGEVPVDRPVGQTGLLDDVGHRGAGEPPRGEADACGVDDLLAAGVEHHDRAGAVMRYQTSDAGLDCVSLGSPSARRTSPGSGKILHGGLSNFSAWRVAGAAVLAQERGLTPLIGIETEHSLLERSADRELLPAAQANGLGALLYSPLAGGLLTGKYRAGGQDG